VTNYLLKGFKMNTIQFEITKMMFDV